MNIYNSLITFTISYDSPRNCKEIKQTLSQAMLLLKL